MAPERESSPQDVDPLRSSCCPDCGYSLFGLRQEGQCPECGFTYGSDIIVLYGWQAGFAPKSWVAPLQSGCMLSLLILFFSTVLMASLPLRRFGLDMLY